MNQTFASKLNQVHQRIRSACESVGRDAESVSLLAVSKTHDVDCVQKLAAAGQRDFGESYVNEAIDKITALDGLGLEWHYIGTVQSNKTHDIAAHFNWVQSVDRARIVRRLDAQRPGHLPPLNVLIQINIDAEPQKAGCTPGDIEALAELIAGTKRLQLRGLMAIPAPRERYDDQKAVFERLHALFAKLRSSHPNIDTLSAGMSDDLEAAIAAGSTMVRVGTALFGARGAPLAPWTPPPLQ